MHVTITPSGQLYAASKDILYDAVGALLKSKYEISSFIAGIQRTTIYLVCHVQFEMWLLKWPSSETQ